MLRTTWLIWTQELLESNFLLISSSKQMETAVVCIAHNILGNEFLSICNAFRLNQKVKVKEKIYIYIFVGFMASKETRMMAHLDGSQLDFMSRCTLPV